MWKWSKSKSAAGEKPSAPSAEKRNLSDRGLRTGRYRHYNGSEYEVVGFALHSETLERLVIYRALNGNNQLQQWVLPAALWDDIVEWNGKLCRRFTYIGDE